MSTVTQFERTQNCSWGVYGSYSCYRDSDAGSEGDRAPSNALPSPLNSLNGGERSYPLPDWVYNANQGLCIFLTPPENDDDQSVDTLCPTTRSIRGNHRSIHPLSHKHQKPVPNPSSAAVRSMVVVSMVAISTMLYPCAIRLERHQAYFVGAGLVLLILLSLVTANGDDCDFTGYSPVNEDAFHAGGSLTKVVPFGSTSPLVRDEYDARSPMFSH